MEQHLQEIESVLDAKVRPQLREHGGNLKIDRLENQVLYIKMQGQCAGCPSADLTTESIVEAELVAALPQLVRRVVCVQDVSDELWEQAKRILRGEKP